MTTKQYQKRPTSEEAIKELKNLLGERFSTEEGDLKKHGNDKSHLPAFDPDGVAYPESTEEVAEVMKICKKYKVVVIPYGVGTSLEGHTSALFGGIHIDTSHMKKVIRFSKPDMDITVEAGLLKTELEKWLKEKDCFFGVDPGSESTVGGWCATGASGTMTVKYGTLRDNVLNLTVVLEDGRILKTANRARKSSSGYDLTHLFMGSEGTLGIITEITLKVYQIPKAISAGSCSFPTVRNCTEAVTEIVQSSLGSLARCEFLNVKAIQAVNKLFETNYTEKPSLFLEFHGNTIEQVESVKDKLSQIVNNHKAEGFQFTSDEEKRKIMWKCRHSAYYASIKLRLKSKLLVTDVCVPISNLPNIIVETEEDFVKEGLSCPIVGHVYDGNFHVMCPIYDEEEVIIERLNARLVKRAIEYEGTCSGEHGVGYGKMDFALQEHGEVFMDISKQIKKTFDPENRLNPGKIFN
ncbi:d-lactate dehydrogenase [Anaeramoeba flamelloides]|uniref:D-lactate dehydrogenase (cytochrome) n=1 Tax=Anaeramoeba flamelloides TaxID=1746091 RepID=A0AAV8A7Y6_9EUKA|nr:d-lactate dehydrogenase [Anaeramoeba flamelloides]